MAKRKKEISEFGEYLEQVIKDTECSKVISMRRLELRSHTFMKF